MPVLISGGWEVTQEEPKQTLTSIFCKAYHSSPPEPCGLATAENLWAYMDMMRSSSEKKDTFHQYFIRFINMGRLNCYYIWSLSFRVIFKGINKLFIISLTFDDQYGPFLFNPYNSEEFD